MILQKIKIKISAIQKGMSKEEEDRPQAGSKYLQNTYMIKDSYLKYMKKL